MLKFHDPLPLDEGSHVGYTSIFNGKTFNGWDADPGIWRVEIGVVIGETFEGKPKGNNYIVYRGDRPRDFDLKLRMKIEKGAVAAFNTAAWQGIPGRARSPKASPLTTSGTC